MNKSTLNNELAEQEFEQQLQHDKAAVRAGIYGGYVNQILPDNASLTARLKYQLCKWIIAYYHDYDLTVEELANKLNLSLAKTQEILYGYVEQLELDELAKYADKLLFNELEAEYSIERACVAMDNQRFCK